MILDRQVYSYFLIVVKPVENQNLKLVYLRTNPSTYVISSDVTGDLISFTSPVHLLFCLQVYI